MPLIAPELLLPHLVGAREALRDLALGRGLHLAVDEAVRVGVLEPADEHPVEAGELGETAPERLRVHLLPVASGGSREVDGVEAPTPGPRWLPAEISLRLRSHYSPPWP